jgi:hypothetical protein
LRKFTVLVAGVALSAAVLAACVGPPPKEGPPPPPPPPPPTDPHDVLVVGDSVAFSFGCVLGDAIPGIPAGGCPARPGYSAKNASVGACTIYGVTVLLYNGGTAGSPNCGPVPAAPENRNWAQLADHYTPKVVVINTGGWEIVDRWVNFEPAPDSQWGFAGCSPSNHCNPAYVNAAVHYSSALFNMINEFLARGAKVLVANQPYANPLQPVPPPNEVPPGLGCSWWEPYPNSPPTAQANGEPNGLTCPGQWRSPTGTTTYRSSRVKFDQFNVILHQVLTNNFGVPGNANVKFFDFKALFNQPDNAYTSHLCPPPNHEVTPDGSLMCPGSVPAILARAPDNGHLTVAGQTNVLRPLLESCVQSMLGVGGSSADCN